MASWPDKSIACTNSWMTLMALQQYEETYDDAEELVMPDFLFWNPNDSPEIRRTKARSLASQVDGVFRHVLNAGYETGMSSAKAVNAMTRTLVDEAKTLPELADVVDDHYRFLSEP